MNELSRRGFLMGVAATAVIAPTVPGVAWAGSAATPVAGHPADVAVAWFDRALALVRGTPGYTPPVAARAFGYLGVALYETLVPGMAGYRPLAGLLPGLPHTTPADLGHGYDWPVAANAALARMARLLFPTAPAAQQQAIDALEAEWSSGGAPGLRRRSANRGQAVADAVFDWSRGDGGHEGYRSNFPTDYTPPEGPGLWRPTPPAFARALQPRWGNNRTFVVESADVGHPGVPTPFSTEQSSPFYAEGLEVYDTLRSLTTEQRDIALFWSDDPGTTATPPGHSVATLNQVIAHDGSTLATAAEGYARLGMAVADSFICCWKVKYQYNLLRPITYILDEIDSSFDPAQLPLTTPPFPEFSSGHSVQSGASATVLTELFGARPYTDHTHDARGLAPRSFGSFHEAAAEAAISRLYGGIHFRPAIDRGITQGNAIGAAVNALPLRG